MFYSWRPTVSEQKAFRLAIEKSDNELVHEMIKKNRYLKNYILHAAIGLNNIELLKHYVHAGVNINKQFPETRIGMTPLYVAAAKNNYEAVKFLIEAGAKLDTTHDKKLFLKYSIREKAIAIGWRKYKIFDYFFPEDDLIVNYRQSRCYSPLVQAISKQLTKIVQLFLDYGADVNIMCHQFGDKVTPLHVAVWCGNIKIIKLLLDHNADINAVSFCGRTSVLHGGFMKDNIATVKYILSAGIDVNIVDHLNRTMLEITRIANFPLSAEVIEEHLVKMKAAGFHLIKQNLEVIDNPKCDQLLTACCEEIKLMKNCRIAHTRVTFYDLLRTNEQTIAVRIKCVKEENVLDYCKEFPLYSDIIDYKFKEVLIRQDRLVKVNAFFEDIFRYLLPSTFAINISAYLGEDYVAELNKNL